MTAPKPYGIIYKAEYQPEGKKFYVYVGQTVQKLRARKCQHKCDALRGNTPLYRALRKYGFENWKWKTLERCNSKEDLDNAEIKWIKYYREQLFNRSMNLDSGGSNGKHSNETKKRMSECKIGELNPSYGEKYSAERKKKMSEVMKGRMAGKLHPMYGKTGASSPRFGMRHSEETKKKISESKKGVSYNIGYKHSGQARKNMSEARKGLYCGESHYYFGKHRSEKVKKKISESLKLYCKNKKLKEKIA